MSHAATNWAIQQRGLKPTTKIVLWHLCDRHNPDFGCFPTQAQSGRGLRDQPIDAERASEFCSRPPADPSRAADLNPGNKRQMPTRYILAFEPGFTQDRPSSVSENRTWQRRTRRPALHDPRKRCRN
jgi:hypothetical protein